MGAIATFSYTGWTARYPEFVTIPEVTVDAYFAEACVYHANDGSGPVNDPTVQLVLLNMLTAHIAAKNQANGVPAYLVGRINSASIGPVSANTDGFPGVTGTQTWLLTTRYGSDYWYATAPFRTMQYRVARNRRVFDPLVNLIR